jgi:hypothetical protein
VIPVALLVVAVLAAAILAPDAPARPVAAAPASDGEGLELKSNERSPLAGLTLESLQASFRADAGTRRKLVARLLTARREDAEQLHAWLHRPSGVPASDYKAVLRAIGAAVPNRAGRFESEEQRPRTAKKRALVEVDWLEALLALDAGKLRSGLARAHSEATFSVALMRALVKTRHPEAAISILRFGYRHAHAFRDETGTQIRALGAYAVPGLVRAIAIRDPDAHKMTRYAAYQLDRIDCVRPDRALKQGDLELRAEILHAYGEVRTPTAVSAVLSYTDDPSELVRRAARWAMLRYVSGRPPKAVKRKLKLPGGKETDRARALYLTYRQLATFALVQQLAEELTGAREGREVEAKRKALAEELEPRYLAEQLFRLYDERREKAQRDELARAMAASKTGSLDQAITRFDGILAAHPFHPERASMAPFYFRKGRELLASGKLNEAQAILTKAIHLDPGAAFVREARARRDLAGALADRQLTSESEWKLRAALRLQPGLEQARIALRAYERRQQQRLWLAGGVGGGVAMVLLLGLTFVRRRLFPPR